MMGSEASMKIWMMYLSMNTWIVSFHIHFLTVGSAGARLKFRDRIFPLRPLHVRDAS
jgi:hypothetical protein